MGLLYNAPCHHYEGTVPLVLGQIDCLSP